MANIYRGEVDIELAGKHFSLRPTFQSICEMENKAGCNLYHLARRFEDGTFTLFDITCVIWSGIRGTQGMSAPDFENIGNHIVESGIASIVAPVCDYVAGCLGVRIERKDDAK